MKFTVLTHIEADTVEQAQAVRDEMAQGAEDGRDSGEFPRSVVWHVGELVAQVDDPALILSAARAQCFLNDAITIDDEAAVTEVASGFWVEARVWVPFREVPQPQVVMAPAFDISEGGHCD